MDSSFAVNLISSAMNSTTQFNIDESYLGLLNINYSHSAPFKPYLIFNSIVCTSHCFSPGFPHQSKIKRLLVSLHLSKSSLCTKLIQMACKLFNEKSECMEPEE